MSGKAPSETPMPKTPEQIKTESRAKLEDLKRELEKDKDTKQKDTPEAEEMRKVAEMLQKLATDKVGLELSEEEINTIVSNIQTIDAEIKQRKTAEEQNKWLSDLKERAPWIPEPALKAMEYISNLSSVLLKQIAGMLKEGSMLKLFLNGIASSDRARMKFFEETVTKTMSPETAAKVGLLEPKEKKQLLAVLKADAEAVERTRKAKGHPADPLAFEQFVESVVGKFDETKECTVITWKEISNKVRDDAMKAIPEAPKPVTPAAAPTTTPVAPPAAPTAPAAAK